VSAFPKSSIKSVCELVLRLMSLNNVVLKGVCLELMNSLLLSKPSVERFSTDINAKVITVSALGSGICCSNLEYTIVGKVKNDRVFFAVCGQTNGLSQF